MASLSLPLGEHLAPDRVMPFLPAPVETFQQRGLSSREVDIQYQVRDVALASPRETDRDPMVVPGVPILRLVANTVATFVLVLAAGLVVAGAAPRLFGYESVVVVSGSMSPSIRMADVVVTSPSDGLDLAEGTVINFDLEGATRLHRIEAIAEDGYRTIGDANATADSELVAPSQIRGVGVVVVPFVGLPATWFERGEWVLLGFTILALAGAVYMSRARWADVRTDLLR